MLFQDYLKLEIFELPEVKGSKDRAWKAYHPPNWMDNLHHIKWEMQL